MALIKCSECGKEFSDKASACPNCGCPTSEMVESPIAEDQEDNLDAIWKTVPGKNNSSIKPHITQKVSAVKMMKLIVCSKFMVQFLTMARKVVFSESLSKA